MKRSIPLLSFTLLLALAGLAAACPMCKDSLANGDPQGNGGAPCRL